LDKVRLAGAGALIVAMTLAAGAGRAADLIVSANDGKFVRVEGKSTYPRPAPPDSLVVIDATRKPPAVVATLEGVEQTVQGPPQSVAITPDGTLAVLGAPTHWDDTTGKEVFDQFIQVVDLEASPPTLIAKVDIGAHPNGMSISPDGKLLLAATLDGTVKVLSINGKDVKLVDSLKLSDRRVASVSFTHDGAAALVTLREDGGVAVLDVQGGTVHPTKERISTGIAPYSVDVSSDGHWADVSDVGLNGVTTMTGVSAGDADNITLIDVSHRPFRAVQYLTVPSIPEGVAISPNGHWIVVQAMDGSNLTPDNPGRHKTGKVVLFRIDGGRAQYVNDVPGGEAAQGIAIGKDNQTIFVQFDVEKAIAVYAIRNGKVVDTGQRMKLAAGPVAIRSMPR